MAAPLYSSEYVDGAQHVLEHHLLPRLVRAAGRERGRRRGRAGADRRAIRWPRRRSRPPCSTPSCGRRDVRSPATSARAREAVDVRRVGRHHGPDSPRCSTAVERLPRRGLRPHQAQDRAGLGRRAGARRARALRRRRCCCRSTPTRAYTLARRRASWPKLDPFGLLLIEQPLDEDDLARPRRAGAASSRTPVCLDESITSAPRRRATRIALGACCRSSTSSPAASAGYLEARRIHDVCAAHGVPVWCGGMLETGIGRAANVALAALPNFTLPGDTSASSRYFASTTSSASRSSFSRAALPSRAARALAWRSMSTGWQS